MLKVILGALPLAVDAVNNNSNLLPGYTLKFLPYDIGRPSSTLRSLPIK